MQSKILIIAAMASVAIGLPLQAQRTQMQNRSRIIGVMAVAQCHLNAGDITEEAARQVAQDVVEDKPYLKPAYSWAINSSNAKAAIDGLAPTLGANCNSEVSDEVVENLILPNLK